MCWLCYHLPLDLPLSHDSNEHLGCLWIFLSPVSHDDYNENCRFNTLSSKLKDFLLWNGTLRLFISQFSSFLISISINLTKVITYKIKDINIDDIRKFRASHVSLHYCCMFSNTDLWDARHDLGDIKI